MPYMLLNFSCCYFYIFFFLFFHSDSINNLFFFIWNFIRSYKLFNSFFSVFYMGKLDSTSKITGKQLKWIFRGFLLYVLFQNRINKQSRCLFHVAHQNEERRKEMTEPKECCPNQITVIFNKLFNMAWC